MLMHHYPFRPTAIHVFCTILVLAGFMSCHPLTAAFAFSLASSSPPSSSSNHNNKNKMRNEAAEEVVTRQLAFLQNRRDIPRAYQEFASYDDETNDDGWEVFAEELQTDETFRPLVEHQQATVVMVIQQSDDPNYCECLVRLILPHNNERRDFSNKDWKIPLYYWFGMKLEEPKSKQSENLSNKPAGDTAVWKVEGIQPASESMELDMDMDEEFLLLGENGNRNVWSMKDIFFDADDDDSFEDEDDDDDEDYYDDEDDYKNEGMK